MATLEERKRFFETIGPCAVKTCRARGYGDAQIWTCLSQAGCETGYGTSELAKKAKNFFGIKASGGWTGKVYSKETGECYDGVNYVTITAAFRAYDTVQEAVDDYFRFIEKDRYKASLKQTSVKDCITTIKNGGYATSPTYINTIVGVYETNKDIIEKYKIEEDKAMGYSNSKLVSYTKLSPNKSKRTKKINRITIHHMAGNLTVESCGNVFANPSRQASSNYGVGTDGRIGLYVNESDRAWTSSNSTNDQMAVTMEVANTTNGVKTKSWEISQKAYDSMINLCVDICKRNGLKKVIEIDDQMNGKSKAQKTKIANEYKVPEGVCLLTQHQYFSSTACPGQYIQARWKQICNDINKKLGASTTPAKPATPTGSFMVKVYIPDLNIRKGPGTNYAKIGKYTGIGKFTIVETKSGAGSKTGWGKLKSGAGWISLDYAKRV